MVLKPPPTQPAPRPAPTGDPQGAPSPAAASVLARVRKSARLEFRDGAHHLTFEALGTRCHVAFTSFPNRTVSDGIPTSVLRWVAEFEAKFSRFIPTSLVSRINAAAGREAVAIDPETEHLLQLCDQVVFMTRGVLDPSSLPLISLWNWKAQPPVVPHPEAIEKARDLCGWRQLVRGPGSIFLPRQGMGIDLGGIGKEFAVDQVAELLLAQGSPGGLVDFGADIRVFGKPADGRPGWHVGLDDPRRPGQCWCGLGLPEGGVATSGDYVRRFEAGGRRYGHILDVRTGRPVDNGCRAVSVLAPTCTLAGMLSTSAFVLGPDEGIRLLEAHYGVEGAMITDTATITTRRFHAHVAS